MKIAILYDATPGEQVDPEVKGALDIARDVRHIERILKRNGFESELVGLDFPVIRRIQDLVKAQADLVFNLCEGLGDESAYEVHVASLLELLGLAFTGSGSLSLALCHNKAITKELLGFHGIPTPKHVLVEPGAKTIKDGLEYPLIVKPVHEDGSFGIDEDSVVKSDAALRAKIASIHRRFRQGAMVEEFIDGREFNVSILGNDPFEFVQMREILFHPSYHPRIVSFVAKWKKSSSAYQATLGSEVQDVPEVVQKEILKSAVQCFKIFKMRDYARVDFRLGESQVPYLIDINPNPCISSDSGMAAAAKQNGLSYGELITKIANLALTRSRGLEGARSHLT